MSFKTQFFAVSLLVTLLVGCTSSPYYIRSYKMILAEQGASDREPIFAKDGDVILEQKIGFRDAAILEQDIQFEIAGHDIKLATGHVLQKATIRHPPDHIYPKDPIFYCDLSQINLAKATIAVATLGLAELGQRTLSGTRLCFAGSNGNSTLSHAVLIGAQGKDSAPVFIPELRYTRKEKVPLSGENYARITFEGLSLTGRLKFNFEVVENGKPLAFTSFRKIKQDELPTIVRHNSAVYKIEKYDKDSRSAEIKVLKPFPEGEYGLKLVPRYR